MCLLNKNKKKIFPMFQMAKCIAFNRHNFFLSLVISCNITEYLAYIYYTFFQLCIFLFLEANLSEMLMFRVQINGTKNDLFP